MTIGLAGALTSPAVSEEVSCGNQSTFENPNGDPACADALRLKLRALQLDHLERLSWVPTAGARPSVRPPGSATQQSLDDPFLDSLRSDLKSLMLNQRPLSGEVDLAIHAAAVRHLEEQAAAYEQVYGRHDGMPTTRYTVLSDVELQGAEAKMARALREHLMQSAALPESAIEQRARLRVDELRETLAEIGAERLRRAGGAWTLVKIGSRPEALDAGEARLVLERAKSPRRAEAILAFEVERRLVWAPDDPHLGLVRRGIREKPAVVAVSLLQRARRGPGPDGGGAPPPSPETPLPPEPKPPTGGGRAVGMVEEGVRDEVDAMTRGNLVERAEAAARWQVGAEYLAAKTRIAEPGWQTALRALETADLLRHKATLETYKKALMQSTALPHIAQWRRVAELAIIEQRLAILTSEISIRGPPAPDLSSGPRGATAMRRAAEIAAGEPPPRGSGLENALGRRTLVELRQAGDVAVPADQPAIAEAITLRARQVVAETGDTFEHTLTGLAETQRRSYVYGRGSAAVIDETQLIVGRRDIEAAASALRSETKTLSATVPDEVFARLDRIAGTAAPAAPSQLASDAAVDMARAATLAPAETISLGTSAPIDLARAPEELRFEARFGPAAPNTAEGFRRAPTLAPGGVVIDATLPRILAERIEAVRYHAANSRFEAKVAGSWRSIDPAVDPLTARAALGFVLDGRVVAADIGAIADNETFSFLIRAGAFPGLPPVLNRSETAELVDAQALLSIVRINPALADTAVAREILGTDELIFSVLHLDRTLQEQQLVFRGIDAVDLHRRLRDARAQHAPLSDRFKSLLTIDQVDVEFGQTIRIAPKFDYAVYGWLADSGGEETVGEPFLLPAVSQWFAAKDADLRRVSPELRRTADFAVAVAVLRTAVGRGLLASFDDFALIADPGLPSPAFLCRSAVAAACAKPFIQSLLSPNGP
ncbi:hypothetical protein [Mesorhizobium sp. 131-2-1]|uniref:hypothetical protein n=1 Tax=Mesorhizobium sp. 131-2-1 TaxID=2744518 RepID=UPI00192589FC|nr:hypothetical protein [Mesorhizobium sp. 131-2-1]